MSDDYIQEPAETYGDQLKRLVVHDERRRQFVMIDYAVLDAIPRIKRNGLAVYCILLRFANRHSRLAWPTWQTMQRLTGLGRDSVRRALRDLEEEGLIETVQLRQKGEFSSNAYKLLDVSAKNTDTDKLDVQELDVQELDVQELVNNLDVSSSELDVKNLNQTQKECAREETDFLKHTEEPDNPACAAYLPGFPCPHMTEAVTVVAQVFWPTRPTVDTHAALGQFRSKELLHEAAHTYTPEQLTSAATWYRTNEPAHRLSLPLFFSGVYGHICNAEAAPISTPTPADEDIVWNDLHEDDAAAPHYFHQLYRRGADIRCWSCEKRHREYTPLTEQECSAHAWAELHGQEVST